MDADTYADEIERRFPDREGLKQVRQNINDDPTLDENAKARLSDRVGTYLLDMDRSGLTEDQSPNTV